MDSPTVRITCLCSDGLYQAFVYSQSGFFCKKIGL